MQKILINFRRYLWFFKRVFSHKHLQIYSFINLGLISLSFVFTWYIYNNISSDLMVLHYNILFGIDKVGYTQEIFVLPLLALAVFILNTTLSISFFRKKHFHFLSHLFPISSLVFNVIIVFSILNLYLVNFF
jgi:ABC-type cobalamin transport system permease subunit